MKRSLLIPVLASLLVSCQGEKTPAVSSDELQLTVRMATVGESAIKWAEGDIVYFSDDAATRPGYQFKAAASDISADGKTLTATYKGAEREAKHIYAVRGKQGRIRMKKTEDIMLPYDGSFCGAGVPVGEAPLGQPLVLESVVPVCSFGFSLAGIASVRIMADKEIFPVKIKYDFGGTGLSVASKKAMAEIPVNGSARYYLPMISGNTAIHLDVSFLNEGGQTLAESSWDGTVNALPGTVFDLGSLDAGAQWVIDPDAPELESAAQAVKAMGIGINNGGFEVLWKELAYQADRSKPDTFEKQSGNALTRQATMDAYAAAGFKSVRIPITWWPHMDNRQATIDAVWLARIKEVVDYCMNANLYCIINMHHDAHASVDQGGDWLFADAKNYESITRDFQNIWKQVATYFKDYDQRLLFEGYNEITDASGTWTYPKSAADMEIANKLNQDFVNTVRRTGGNNVTRNLVVSTYSCSVSDKPLQAIVMPSDFKPGHLMVQVHNYAPTEFCTFANASIAVDVYDEEKGLADIRAALALMKRYILDKGWPCILGEYGAPPEHMATAQQPNGSWRIKKPESERAKHAYQYTLEALKTGVVPMYWYSPMDGSGRSTGKWSAPVLKDAIIQALNDFNTQ